ncbi:MAG: hypothetical protein KGZ83_13300, partial [Sulfuricella sp.]|nr:hypothetical protein [Sulfuricella sp.]
QINFRHARYAFSHRFAREFEEAGNFDAIFCLAVLQRTENRTRTNSAHAEGFLFSHFEQEITLLDQKLKPGGLLIIDHTDFRFTETVCGPRYQPIEFKNNRLLRKRPLFDRNNRKISDTTHEYRVFVKQGST